MPAIDDDLPWDAQLTTWFSELRQQFLARPQFFDLPSDRTLLLANPEVERKLRQRLEHVVTMLNEAGISRDDAYRIYHICGVFVRGFVKIELDDAGHSDLPRWVTPSSDHMDERPEIDILALRWPNSDRQFELGLKVLVAGIRASMVDGAAVTLDAARAR
jgi:hypothetical protein